MKPKTPTKKRGQKKGISLVIPDKKSECQAEAPITTETELASSSPVEPEPPMTAEALASSAKPKPAVKKKPKKKPARPAVKVDHQQIAALIADALGETKNWPRTQIKHVVWALGHEQALELAKRAQAIEDAGGMLALNGQHRRTVGGIFFYLCYSQGKPRPGKVLTRPPVKPKTMPREDTQTEGS